MQERRSRAFRAERPRGAERLLTENATMSQEYTKYQQKVIQRYYDNQDKILIQRLSDQVGDLYLAEGKKREKLWTTVATTLEKLKVPASRSSHILEKKDPTLLAKLLQELLK